MSLTIPAPGEGRTAAPVDIALQAEDPHLCGHWHAGAGCQRRGDHARRTAGPIAAARDRLTRLDALADQYEALALQPGPCFAWCQHDGRHPGEHESAPVQLAIPAAVVNGPEPLELISALLYHEDNCWDTGLSVNPPGGLDGAMLHGDEIDAFADSLVRFAAQIRRMRQQADETRPGYDTEAVAR